MADRGGGISPSEYPLVPTFTEINREVKNSLKPNKVNGPYESVAEYCSTQFHLLRETITCSLRDGVKTYKETLIKYPDMAKSSKFFSMWRDTNIYADVTVNSWAVSNCGFVLRLQINPKQFRNARWENSKSLLGGSLLCLSCDDFNSGFFAVITERDVELIQHGYLEVRLINTQLEKLLQDLLRKGRYFMIECTEFYEAYRHSMKILQQLNEESFPLKEYVIQVSTEIFKPSYYDHDPNFDLSDLCSPLERPTDFNDLQALKESIRKIDLREKNIYSSQLPWDRTCLDKAQWNAFISGISHKLALIHGPPGTGKSYIGQRIVQVLLRNKSKWQEHEPTPILVLCYKNVMLDQFLIDSSRFTEKIVRVGTQLTNLSCEKYSLIKLRENCQFDNRSLRPFLMDRKKVTRELVKIIDKVIDLHEGFLIDGEQFAPYIKEVPQQYQSFVDLAVRLKHPGDIGIAIIYWLFEDAFKACEFYYEEIIDFLKNMPEFLRSFKKDESDDEETPATAENEEGGDDLQCSSDDEGDALGKVHDRVFDRSEYARIDDVTSSDVTLLTVQYEKIEKKIEDPRIKRLFKVSIEMRDILKMKGKPMDKMEARAVTDIFQLKECKNRLRLYHYWRDKYKTKLSSSLKKKEIEMEYIQSIIGEFYINRDFKLCRDKDIVCMTITGASKYNELVQLLKPKVVIVEEAAEVLEPFVITSLCRDTRHLIMIGDHLQLRPPVSHHMATKYQLDVSLFERFVKNGVPMTTLNKQHRMRPEISGMLRPWLYKDLEDHIDVKNYPPFGREKHCVLFLDHSAREHASLTLNRGYRNIAESRWVVNLVYYLILKGHQAKNITVLAAYNAQKELITEDFAKMAKEDPLKTKHKFKNAFEDLRILTIDSFQGNQNEIIILSLVRNNTHNDIGFLKHQNRVCVALSRARQALFAFGNFTMYEKRGEKVGEEAWCEIVSYLRQNNFLSSNFPFVCKCGRFSKEITSPDHLHIFLGMRGKLCTCLSNT